MKLTRNLIVELDGAKFHFRKPDLRTILDLKKKGLDGSDYLVSVLESCVKVEGVWDEDGNAVPVEHINQLRLTQDVIAKLLEAYNRAMSELLNGGEETQEKKETASA
jgi:hypothetical protein